MTAKPCDNYREQIEQYVCNELDAAQSRLFLEHIGQCPACREYLESLNLQEQQMAAWAGSLEPLVQNGRTETLSRFRQMQSHKPPIAAPKHRCVWPYYAAAAGFLIVAGFLVGRFSSPNIDTAALQKELAASLRPQIESQVAESVVQSLRKEVVGQYAKMQDTIAGQISTEMKAYAEQTVVRNDIQTYRLLTELIDAIKTSQSQNQQWVLSAMDTLEKCRLQDQNKMRTEFASFAVFTGNELTRTQEQLKTLSTRTNN